MREEVKEVEGVYVETYQRHEDIRGYFQEVYSSIRYDANLPHIAQANVSCSRKNVIRGLHVAHFNKLCTVLRGRVFDVVADVRKGSSTLGNWFGVWLDDKNCKQVFVPAGCAHGFFSDEDDSLFLYHQDGLYKPEMDVTINWRDPTLKIDWPNADWYDLSYKDLEAKEWMQ